MLYLLSTTPFADVDNRSVAERLDNSQIFHSIEEAFTAASTKSVSKLDWKDETSIEDPGVGKILMANNDKTVFLIREY